MFVLKLTGIANFVNANHSRLLVYPFNSLQASYRHTEEVHEEVSC